MSRVLHAIEKGLRIYAENSNTAYVDFLFGSAAPGGDAGDQDAASIGSIYLRDNGSFYQKTASTNATSDWTLNGSSSAVIGTWRGERIRAVTNDTVSAGARNLSTTPFSDDESPLLTAADFVVGDYVIADADGTPALMEVTAVSSPNVTFAAAANPLVANDTFVAINYLPDSPGAMEGQAIVNYNGSLIVKLGDIDWSLATGINLSGSYVAASGNVAANDTVEAAIAKLDGVNDNQDTLLGTAQGATNLGTFTGTIIPDNSTVKAALQSLETEIENGGHTSASAITTITTVDSVLVDNYSAVKWYVVVSEDATPANKKAFEIFALHNGTASADASSVDDDQYSILKKGSNFNLSVSVDLNGTGASQVMRLRVASTSAGVSVKAYREVIKF